MHTKINYPLVMNPSFLSHSLNAWFGSKLVLKNINIDFKQNCVTALIGPSGCGKTTLLRCINRMHEMTPNASVKGQYNSG